MSKRIFRFDASLMKQSSCDLRIKLISFDGYREKKIFNDTLYGTSFHKFSSRMYESGGDFAQAVLAAKQVINKPCVIRDKKEHLTEQHLLKTCFDFWQKFETNNNNFHLLINPKAICWKCNGTSTEETFCDVCKSTHHIESPMVEQSFEITVRETDDYVIKACGTIDKIGKFTNGCYAIGDIKTTSSWDIKKFLAKWKLNPQLKFYIWAIHRMHQDNPNSILSEMCKTKIGAFIDGVFLKSKTETLFERSEVYIYSDTERELFSRMLEKKIDQLEALIQDYLNNRFIYPTGIMNESCNKLFPCSFYNYCAAPDDIAAQHVLTNNFRQRVYDPLNFGADELIED